MTVTILKIENGKDGPEKNTHQQKKSMNYKFNLISLEESMNALKIIFHLLIVCEVNRIVT